MYRDDDVRLRHMRDAAQQALQFTRGRTRDDLDDDPILSLALVKLIEIVGEAAGQVSHEGRIRVADLPWTDIVGMRNRLVHAYFDINLDILWQTIVQDLPTIVALLNGALGTVP